MTPEPPSTSPANRSPIGTDRSACPISRASATAISARCSTPPSRRMRRRSRRSPAIPKPPTIENTLAALELAGDPLDRVSSIFWCRAGAHTNDAIQAMEREISPKMSRHFSAISMNERLFARIDDLYQRRASLGLDAETLRLVEKTWKGFVKSGAKLDAGRQGAARRDQRGAVLARHDIRPERARRREGLGAVPRRGDDLAGLPDFLKSAMAEAAETRGQKGRYAVTLSRSIYEPFITFSERRDLREQAFRAFAGRGETGGATDNAPGGQGDARAARREGEARRL